jgi:CHAD domain-containing protein
MASGGNLRKVALMGNGEHPVNGASAVQSSDVVRHFVGNEVGNLLHFDPVAREGRDPEGVHQLRVSCRRLRAELTLMKPVFEPEVLDHLLTELKWLGKTLGRRRDLYVRTSLAEHVMGDFPSWFSTELRATLRAQAPREDEKTQRLLESARYRRLMATLAETVVRPPLNERADTPATDVLRAGMCDALLALVNEVESVGLTPNYLQLHDVRIYTKKVRYSAVLSTPLFGLPAEHLARSLEKVQTVLGELHDRVLVLDYLNQAFDQAIARRPTADLKRPRASMEHTLNHEIKRLNSQWRQPYAKALRYGAELCRPHAREGYDTN